MFVLLPAFLAALWMRYMVPTSPEADGRWSASLASAADEYPIPFAVGLFLLFAMLIRYWARQLRGAAWFADPRTSFATDVSREGDGSATRPRGRSVAGVIALAAVAGLSAFVLRGYVLTPYRVLSASMLPTLAPGDVISASRIAYGLTVPGSAEPIGAKLPKRGDLVVFRSPDPEQTTPVIKRVIGLPGDRVAMLGSRPIINDWEVPTCDAGLYLYALPEGAVKARLIVEYLDDLAYLTIAAPPPREFPQPYDVQPGEIFVLGDNRNNSSDSRAWNDGRGAGVEIADIEGRANYFLVAKRRDQRADLSRVLESIRGTRLHLEGVDTAGLREGIEQCLRDWPKETHIPERGVMSPAKPSAPGKILGD